MSPFETGPGLEQVDLQPYQRRVIQEGTELKDRISKIEMFLVRGTGASPAELSVMYEQMGAMKKYHAALVNRSILWVREGKLKPPAA